MPPKITTPDKLEYKHAYVLVRRDTFEFMKFTEPLQWTSHFHEACLFSEYELQHRGWFEPTMMLFDLEDSIKYEESIPVKSLQSPPKPSDRIAGNTYYVDVVKLQVAVSRPPQD